MVAAAPSIITTTEREPSVPVLLRPDRPSIGFIRPASRGHRLPSLHSFLSSQTRSLLRSSSVECCSNWLCLSVAEYLLGTKLGWAAAVRTAARLCFNVCRRKVRSGGGGALFLWRAQWRVAALVSSSGSTSPGLNSGDTSHSAGVSHHQPARLSSQLHWGGGAGWCSTQPRA